MYLLQLYFGDYGNVGSSKKPKFVKILSPSPLPFLRLPRTKDETQRTCLGLPSLPYRVFYPYCQSPDGREVVRWRHNQIFWHQKDPILSWYGASRARTLRF